MKKLMIAACAIAISAVANAASYTWSGSDIYACWSDPTSENYAGGAVYLFVAGVNGATYADVISSVTAGTFANVSQSKAVQSTTIANDGSFLSNYESTTDLVGSDMFAVIIADSDAGTAISPKQGSYTDTVTAGAQPALGSALVKFNSIERTYDPSGWTAQGAGPGPGPVPEPTSGLLLLVGMAGLALRRRRV